MMADPTDRAIEPVEWEDSQVICRRKLDEERGNPWICGCERCRLEREKDERNKN